MIVNSKMTALADAIRSKSGRTGKMGIDAMIDAVNSISASGAIQRKSGSFTTDSNGAANVDCGFKPDVVVIYAPEKNEDGYEYNTACCIELFGGGIEVMELYKKLLYFGIWETENGFTFFEAQTYDFSWNWAQYSGKTMRYEAIKYT